MEIKGTNYLYFTPSIRTNLVSVQKVIDAGIIPKGAAILKFTTTFLGTYIFLTHNKSKYSYLKSNETSNNSYENVSIETY